MEGYSGTGQNLCNLRLRLECQNQNHGQPPLSRSYRRIFHVLQHSLVAKSISKVHNSSLTAALDSPTQNRYPRSYPKMNLLCVRTLLRLSAFESLRLTEVSSRVACMSALTLRTMTAFDPASDGVINTSLLKDCFISSDSKETVHQGNVKKKYSDTGRATIGE